MTVDLFLYQEGWKCVNGVKIQFIPVQDSKHSLHVQTDTL